MLQITIIQVGKTKDQAIKELVAEYQKRLNGVASIAEISIKTEPELWNHIPKNSYVIALDDKGKTFTSQEFANFIETRKNQGDSHLVFLIGPANGFSKFKEDPRLKLSLSSMTFSHQTVRILLAEQIYRAISILEGKPFAK